MEKEQKEISKPPNSQIIKTIRGIADFYGVSERTVSRRIPEMKAEGCIFEISEGRPPRKTICSYPNLLQEFVIKKGKL